MLPPMTLRQLTAADLAALQTLYEASAGYFLAHRGAPAPPEQAAVTYADVLERGDRALLGIWWQGAGLIGCFDLRFDHPAEGVAWFGALILADDLPGPREEVASWATRILEEWLRLSTSAREIRLALPAQDRAGVRFWAGQGYRVSPEGLRQWVGSSQQRFLIYYKRLADPS
ncbi:MAG: hypothetical protein HUU23_11195 [Caldilineales bacterium]|nr:hypothetical protein [Caldilineales bacterium]